MKAAVVARDTDAEDIMELLRNGWQVRMDLRPKTKVATGTGAVLSWDPRCRVAKLPEECPAPHRCFTIQSEMDEYEAGVTHRRKGDTLDPNRTSNDSLFCQGWVDQQEAAIKWAENK